MAAITFWEKPGCANNARQTAMLRAAGHEVTVRNLLTEAWTGERLKSFFGGRPVAQWINPAAPAVKSGAVVPLSLDEAEALARMLKDPLLIRRPLMEWAEGRMVGFDLPEVEARLGLTATADLSQDLQTCRKVQAPGSAACPDPATGSV